MKGTLRTGPEGTRCYLPARWERGMPAVHLLDGKIVEGMLPELLAGLEGEGAPCPPWPWCCTAPGTGTTTTPPGPPPT
ncbi:hypothetical protein NE646_10655 [Bittarella massiliensis]|uniref:Uncharacterized protein n=1 Tax=Bittarella massiliensis (ex Durand et al. 2017) TaxID=1720313 RepID=A0AAW5KB05_9FIRM|nr:hypothetical protein [Bittarella massiliensis (ex Durand et al. 2017)]